jgi:Tc5 transposase C-terminal domain
VCHIPKKTTDRIQPLDVYFFRMWKNFVRVFSDRVLVDSVPILLYQRDNILKLQSLVHNQFSAERFVDFTKHSWRMAGYVEEKGERNIERFTTPTEFCFPGNLPDECGRGGCPEGSFIKCAHCEVVLCFGHFFTDYHYHGDRGANSTH